MHQFSIKYPSTVDDNELSHAMYGVLGAMRHNGQLLARHMEPYYKDGVALATIVTATAEALDEKYHNSYVKKEIAALEKLCGNPLIIKHVGFSEYDSIHICNCTEHDFFVLSYHNDLSPILCGNCEKQVPLFRMPKMHDDGYWNLTCWQSAFMGVALLDLNCGTGEKWAMKQQCDPKSGLSIQGRKVAAKLQEVTGVKTYYYLANFSKGSRKKDRARPCPECANPDWKLAVTTHHYMDYKCDNCQLMSSFSNNVSG
jgi:predicted  nucleic acid-binding Zn ribbon protein